MSDESTLQQNVQIQARYFDCTLMRNNRGACSDKTGRLIRFGLGHIGPKDNYKSVDLIGITKVVITQAMVGKTLGVFTALEAKEEGWNPNKKLDDHEEKQNNFLQWVKSMGGIASFVHRVDSLKEIFRQ